MSAVTIAVADATINERVRVARRARRARGLDRWGAEGAARLPSHVEDARDVAHL